MPPLKGILVTRFFYIRMVDPQTVLLTGLTRDGTFYIENGKIQFPVKNFRFNESPLILLTNVEELGKPERTGRPHEKTTWIDKGVIKNLYYSRFWAQKKNVKAIPPPNAAIMEGGTASLEDLIKGT